MHFPELKGTVTRLESSAREEVEVPVFAHAPCDFRGRVNPSEEGAFMCEADAKAAGEPAAKNERHVRLLSGRSSREPSL
jgi:hypothetical protein